MEDVISATSGTGTSGDAQLAENSDMDIPLSTDNLDEIMPTLVEYTSISPPASVGENNTILPNQQQTENQLRAFIESFTGADSILDTYGTMPNQPEKTNEMMSEGTFNQLEANDTAMPTADNSEAAREVPPYIQASLESLNDTQISGQQPLEYTRNSPGPLATVKEAEPSYQAENATIAIFFITETNATPELITFRPGIYEGDAIPPLYSNISIIAAQRDYEPQMPSLIYPELTIIPEPIPEDQIITEPINLDVETTVDQDHLENDSDEMLNALEAEAEPSSQEITVKSPLAPKETKEDLATSVTVSMISVPDPLGICVTSYSPPVPNEELYNAGFPSNTKHMTVPKDTKVKVTISTKPRTLKPRIYYDGKLAPQCTTRKKSTSLSSTNVPTTSQEGTIRTIGMTNAPFIFPPAPPGISINSENTRNSVRYAQDTNSTSTAPPSASILNDPFRTIRNPYIPNANVAITPVTANIQTLYVASSSSYTLPTPYTNTTSNSLTGNRATDRPLINIPSSQIVNDLDPEDSLTLNTFVSRVQTQTPEQQVSHRELPNTQDNMPLAVTTSAGSFSQTYLSPTVLTTTVSVRRPRPIRTSNLHKIPKPSLRRTMIPTGYIQSLPLARACNEQPNPRSTHSNE